MSTGSLLALMSSILVLVLAIVAATWKIGSALGAVRLEVRELRADLVDRIEMRINAHRLECLGWSPDAPVPRGEPTNPRIRLRG